MRPGADGCGGISTLFIVNNAASPICRVRGWPTYDSSQTPAWKISVRRRPASDPFIAETGTVVCVEGATTT